jgi:hypothetical protein
VLDTQHGKLPMGPPRSLPAAGKNYPSVLGPRKHAFKGKYLDLYVYELFGKKGSSSASASGRRMSMPDPASEHIEQVINNHPQPKIIYELDDEIVHVPVGEFKDYVINSIFPNFTAQLFSILIFLIPSSNRQTSYNCWKSSTTSTTWRHSSEH